MIEDAIKNGAKSYEDVEKQLRFGTGCGKCKEFIQFLIRDLLAEAWYNLWRIIRRNVTSKEHRNKVEIRESIEYKALVGNSMELLVVATNAQTGEVNL